MPSHAEKNQTEIENYYHIIDPEGRLSENERAKEENKVLAPLHQRYQSQRLVATEMERLKVFLRKTWLHYALLCTFLHGFRLRS